MKWEELREEEFEKAIELSGKLCVLPIGCTEMHGEHLPVGTDTINAEFIANEAAKIEPVCVFPTIHYGNVPFLTAWKGSIRLTVELMQQLLTELCAEIARNGFKKILILNAHGGNPALLANFVSSTQHTKKDYVVMYRDSYRYGMDSMVEDFDKEPFPELTEEDKKIVRAYVEEGRLTGHACMEETATTMAIRPELVDLSRTRAVDGFSTHKADYLDKTGINNGSARFWVVNFPNQYCAYPPDEANERIGRALLRKQIEDQAEACRLLKMDDRILEWNEEWNRSW